ncbi:XRE family transcriptional regulator [Paractinoplanes rishiriensis]|uniref:XRE family transcriptional regulator n=1 Tax=Paractinoplanes rishiriensis TaxID=1050105 RepID=A0A919MYF3_9ACTN|nr:XRE family transcriptional regulator [Actinoplanes rishiriensis]
MRFGILGPTELRDGQGSVPLGAAKQRGLLSLLLLRFGRPVHLDTLVEHLWPGGTGDQRKSIYPMVSRLRAVLRRSGVRFALDRVGGGYQLDIDPLSVDFHEFGALVEQSRQATPAVAAAQLQRAIDLWRGEPLADLRGPAAEHLRRQLGETHLEAHRLLAAARLRIGQHTSVLMQLASLIHEQDLDESLARLWISALCADGRDDDARRHLAAFRKRFRRQLHIDPEIDFDSIRSGQLNAAAGRPRQLPYGIPGFIGRADLLADLDRLAETGPDRPSVVMITGMPGVGKTALAVHWARRRLAQFPDGQLFLDCGAFGSGTPVDPAEALGRFLSALGVPPDKIPEDPEERRHRFNDLVDGRRLLIVLDNVAGSTQARPLIPAAVTCMTIITSRQRLSGLTIREGVHNLVGYPLAETESSALLAQVVGEQRAAGEPAAVDRLAGIAGGLPLALRIIGEQVAERPRARIADLAGELLWQRTGDDDLVTVFDWSYNALSPEAATLFRRLALHPGTRISLDSAAALSGAGRAQTEQTLNLLARASLIEHDAARHYRLHDLLRQYAGTREDSPAEITAARITVLSWFLRSATNAAAVLAPDLPPVPDLPPAPPHVMEFATEAAALAWCQQERQNLAAAARSAVTHGLYRHGWQIPAAIHDLLTRTGRYDDLINLNQIGAESARQDAHTFGEIANLSNLGYALCKTHQYDRAAVTLSTARARASESGDVAAESVCAHNLACALLKTGDAPLAIKIFLAVRATSRQLGNRYGEAATLHRLGDAYRQANQRERALATYTEALEIRRRIGSARGQGESHQGLSGFYLESGNLSLAAEHCAAALLIHERIQDTAGRCDALITRADIDLAAEADTAVAHARAAVAACAELGDSYRQVNALALLADALQRSRACSEAARIRDEALRMAVGLSEPDASPLREKLLSTTRDK